mgnify:CR=1 FL=1
MVPFNYRDKNYVNARDRIGTGPWQNAKGTVIARNVQELHSMRSALVKDLQSGAWLTKVTEARDTSNRGWIVFEADLARHRAPAGTERPAAAVAAPPVPLAVQPAAPQASAQR